MQPLTITAANSSFILTIAGLYDAGQKLEGYMADAAFATEDVEPAETVLGVDGHLSAGWLPTAVKQTISLMPDSPSYAIFENWHGAQATQREVMQASAVIVIPSLNKTYTCTKGFLTSVKLMPDAKKVMEGSQFQITWNFITPANN